MSTRNRRLLLILVCVLSLFAWSLFLRAKPVAPPSRPPAPVVTVTLSPPIIPFTGAGGDILDGVSTD